MNPRNPITLLAFAIALPGCAGSVVVEHFVQAEVTLRDEAGNTTSPGHTVTLPRAPKMSVLFDSVEYRSNDFDWNFGTSAPVRGGGITNRSTSTLCLRFDEARMRSNLHPEPVRLIVSSWVQSIDHKLTRLAWDAYGAQREFRPPALCLEPGKHASYRAGSDLRELFPTGHLFNTSWPKGVPTLIDKGIGNWVALTIPMEIGGKRTIVDAKVTALESGARISYY